MTLVVYLASVFTRNASMYDPYWSVIPILFLVYWYFLGEAGPGFLVSGILVVLWGIRLTWNWSRSWEGLDHQDWRYTMLRERSKAFYPLVNLLGIHLFPTLMVFLGCIPLFFTVSRDMIRLEWVAVGAIAGLLGIYLEWRADRELFLFRQKTIKGALLREGLWGFCRHPNYLGEILFWWGLAFIGYGHSADVWNFIGAISITLMFLIVSLPMIERRHQRRRDNYEDYMKEVPLLIPFTKRKSR
jgi:steroid 5-alpha reductase family enzyme